MRATRSLWLKNRKGALNTRPFYPQSLKADALRSFCEYRERELNYYVPKHRLKSMTDAEKIEYFNNNIYKGRSVRHYNYRVENGEVKLDESVKRIPSIKGGRNSSGLTDKRGKVLPEIREALVIKPSKTARLQGITPFPIGSQPQKVFGNNKYFFEHIKYYSEKGEKWSKHIDYKYHDRVSVNGSWGSQIIDFQAMCDPVDHEVTYKEYEQAIISRFDKIKLPFLTRRQILDVLTVPTNPKASPGIVSSKLFGARHSKADSYLKPLAIELFKRTGEDLCVDNSLWSVGGRARR